MKKITSKSFICLIILILIVSCNNTPKPDQESNPVSEISRAYESSGIEAMKNRKYGEAVGYFQLAIKESPNNQNATRYIGLCYDICNVPDSAYCYYTLAIVNDSSDWRAYKRRADLFLRNNKHLFALDDYSKALEFSADNNEIASIYYNMAECKLKRNDFEGAINDYYKMMELDSTSISEQKIYEKVLKELRKGRNLSNKEYELIIRSLYKMIEYEKNNAIRWDYYLDIADYKFRIGEYKDAIDILSEFLKKKPDPEGNTRREFNFMEEVILMKLIDNNVKLKNYSGVIQLLTKLIKLESSERKKAEYYAYRGLAKIKIGKVQDACNDFNLAHNLSSYFLIRKYFELYYRNPDVVNRASDYHVNINDLIDKYCK